MAGKLNTQAADWQYTGSVTIQGDLTVQGQAQVSNAITGQGGVTVSGGEGALVRGSLTAEQGGVMAQGVSLTHHTHGGVEPGGGQTGRPQ